MTIARLSSKLSNMANLLSIQELTAPPTLLALALLPPLVYYGNPAVALLVGAVLALALNRAVIPGAEHLGKYALQSAIVLLGFKLNATQLMKISADYSVLVTGYVATTLCIGLALGLLVRNQSKSSALIASGTAICGGTAIASLSPVIEARPEQTGVALTLVFLLNALALFTFPAVGNYLALTQEQFGVWAALAIHDTSSVVATSALYGEEAAMVATTVKLGRTLWLIPLLLVFSVLQHRGSAKLRIPLFVILFIASACTGSFITLPAEVVSSASSTCAVLLVIALFCIGTQISRSTIKNLRGTVLAHGLLLWALAVPLTLLAVIVLV